MTQSVVSALLGLAGFCLAYYLRCKKAHKGDVFVCPMKASCTEVIHSSFASFFGVPVELLGTLYYLSVTVGYSLRVALPLETVSLITPLLLLATIALTFSTYLTFIQLVRIRKLCTWCLLSAVLCLCIFLLAIQGFPTTIW